MELAQGKPLKKRRRWLIVAFVLVLASVAWWYLPSGNRQFVGKWKCDDRIVHFRDDGTVDGFVQFDGNRLLLRVEGLARFKALGNRLQILPDPDVGLQSLVNDMKRLFKWRTQNLVYDGEILNFTPSEVTLRGRRGPGSEPTSYTLTRIPE